MEGDALLLSRIQFAFTVSFHIIFPSFTIGLAAWLATLQGIYVATKAEIYDRLFQFWLKIFAVVFGMGVVSGIVMAFQFGTNWSVFSAKAGPIMGPLLAYESFTAFLLEATFLGVLLFGRDRVPPLVYFFAAVCVAVGTTFSAYWIMVNNSWMHYPVGQELVDGRYVPSDWFEILFSEAVLTRFPHMLLGGYLTTAFCVAATGAWYLLRGRAVREAKVMVTMALGLSALLVPAQIMVGHEAGLFVREHQPEKYAAMEGRWETEQGAPLIVFGVPLPEEERNAFEIKIPGLGSTLVTGDPDSTERGLNEFVAEQRPPLWIPFYGFRIMVGLGLVMLALAWVGMVLLLAGRLFSSRIFLRSVYWSWPSGFVAVVTGWFVSEVGRQPWTIQYLMETAESGSPIGTVEVAISLTAFIAVYSLIFASGSFYINRILRDGLDAPTERPDDITSARRPLAIPGQYKS